ncbi:hypothetical protein M8818_003870 [Zalaria obscura]|uniref:Uncharacterized protein n=1 Tax=Zalaria obscura TaxID=2024903 RepID=A0ACC3SGR2_9PEZI
MGTRQERSKMRALDSRRFERNTMKKAQPVLLVSTLVSRNVVGRMISSNIVDDSSKSRAVRDIPFPRD